MHASSTTGIDNSTIPGVQSRQPFFDGMVVAFPTLEDFVIEADTGSDIWEEKYYYGDDNISSFCKLKSLSLFRCDELETVIPPAMLNRMRNLETIHIFSCKSLRNVFPPCIARDLIHLKSMTVSGCRQLRDIIGVDEHEITGGIVFPELTYLLLYELPNLTSFWCYHTGEDTNYKVEFPNLVELDLGCENNNCGAKELSIDDFTCQRLEWLALTNCGNSTALSLSVLRSLQQLQYLEIYDSASLEEIVEDLRGDKAFNMDKKTITLLQLKYFTLKRLPNIKGFIFNANYECLMPTLTEVEVGNCGISTLFTLSALRSLPQLQKLEISNCSLLEEIVECARGDEASGMDKKTITLFQLRSIILKNLPNLKSFFRIANHVYHMPALTKVEVNNCGISTLFKCSVSGKLHQLTELDVQNCKLLESIVDDVENDETSFADDKTITFSRLTKLHLRSLPSLKCFSSTSSHTFSMPILNDFSMESCPQMEYFTFLKANTPMARVYVGWKEREHIPDLNDYIRQNCKRGSRSSDSVEKLSYSAQELETESERVEKEQPEEGTKENDQL